MFQYMLLLRGATRVFNIIKACHNSFNTCSSCEEQRSLHLRLLLKDSFNTCSSCEEQLDICRAVRLMLPVSIHAPLARSNRPSAFSKSNRRSFNTCSSCEEQLVPALSHQKKHKFQYMLLLRGATKSRKHCKLGKTFQYMLLLRGATPFRIYGLPLYRCFNTCSSCEEQLSGHGNGKGGWVSIHAPLARSNLLSHYARTKGSAVSIHAPLARSNWLGIGMLTSYQSFNTCSSCEEQLFHIVSAG